MKRSLFHLCAIAALACLSMVDLVIDVWRTSRDWVVRLAMAPISMCTTRAGVVAQQPTVELISARSFFARWARRAQPRVEAQWRLCSSA